jgi:hypothetical protein
MFGARDGTMKDGVLRRLYTYFATCLLHDHSGTIKRSVELSSWAGTRCFWKHEVIFHRCCIEIYTAVVQQRLHGNPRNTSLSPFQSHHSSNVLAMWSKMPTKALTKRIKQRKGGWTATMTAQMVQDKHPHQLPRRPSCPPGRPALLHVRPRLGFRRSHQKARVQPPRPDMAC